MAVLYGWDMSHYDAPSIGNAIGQGIGFITHKAGGDANDTEIASWWSSVRGNRITTGDLPALADGITGKFLPGAYWVLYPGSAASRADAFLARLDATCAGWRDHPFILQADCEIWNNDSGTKPGKSDIAAFCDRLRAKAPQFMPVVYASKGQYGDALTGLGYPLWNANYPSSASGSPATLYANAGGDSGPGWRTYSGQTPAIWQFSSSATIGGQTTCDANAYRGSLADLIMLLAPGWENDVATISDTDITRIVNAIKAADVNPDPTASYTLSGAVWTILNRTTLLAGGTTAAANHNAADHSTVDHSAVLAGVLAGVSPHDLGQGLAAAGVTGDTLAKALPDDLAKDVADKLAQRFR